MIILEINTLNFRTSKCHHESKEVPGRSAGEGGDCEEEI